MKELITDLRLKCGLNYFKKHVIGGAHVPGQDQASVICAAVDRMMASDFQGSAFDERTWRSWFGPSPNPKESKIELLDRLLFEHSDGNQNPQFIHSLVYGGLVSHLKEESSAFKKIALLHQRASEYQTISDWHLLFDAVEIAALETDFNDDLSVQVRAIATGRGLEELYINWKPKTGRIYSDYRSRLVKVLNEKSGEDETRKASFNPPISSVVPERYYRPNWDALGIESVTQKEQIHRVLIRLAKEPEFVEADGFRRWAWDMFVATFLLFSQLWLQRNESFGRSLSPDSVFFNALSTSLFWGTTKRDIEEQLYLVFIDAPESDVHQISIQLFKARRWLIKVLAVYGLKLDDFSEALNIPWASSPMIFK